jgi:hypothetical protein
MARPEDIQKAVAIGSVAFGAVATVAPRLFLGMYGVPDEPPVRTMTRLWGTRTAVLGGLMFALEGAQDQQRLMSAATAMNAADTVLVASARGVPLRARVLGSLTSAGFAGALAYALKK